MTRGEQIAREGDTGGDVTSPQVVSSRAPDGANLTPAANPQPAAGAFWVKRWAGKRTWTPERDAYLKAAWERGDAAADIQVAVNAMPGPPVTGRLSITSQVRARGYRRPAWLVAELTRRGGLAVSPWTDERRDYVREAYPRGDRVEAILAAVNAMPGKPLPSITSIRNFCEKNSIRRPKNYGAAAAAEWKHTHGAWTAERREKLAELWAGPLSCPQIALIINSLPGSRDVSANACQRKAWDLKLPGRARGPKPEADRPAKQPRLVLPRTPKPPKPAAQKQRLGERNTFVFCAQATPPAVAEVPAYDAARPGSVESRVEKAKAMLRSKQDAFDISKATGLPLWRVMALIGQLRMERAA